MMLFSKRYSNLIEFGNGESKDHICGEIEYQVKEKIASVMYDFAEPTIIHPNRYDSYEERTDALHLAVQVFNDEKGVPYISLTHNVFDGPAFNPLATAFTPFLFDIIELQYKELSDGEKTDFQSEINNVFIENDIPWLLHDGRMIKVDSQQFEQDLKQKALLQLHELTDSAPIFQSAYDEFMKSIEFFQKGDYAEAISNAGKSYESVMKVILQVDRGNADKLTKELIGRGGLDFPESMAGDGFREKVLMSLPFIRNNSTASHGAGRSTVKVSKDMANLATNLPASLNSYLIDVFREVM